MESEDWSFTEPSAPSLPAAAAAVSLAEHSPAAPAAPTALADRPEPSEPSELSSTTEVPAAPRRAPATHPESRGFSLLARVLLADLGVAFVALVALIVIEVQRMGETGLSLRRQAYVEDLAVLFFVAVVFGVVTFLLVRARHLRTAIVQGVVTALVLGVAITSAATGYPKPVSVEQDQ